LSGQANLRFECPHCGFIQPSNDDLPGDAFFRPWHLRGKHAVKSYVESLGVESREWLLALYVGADLELLAVDTVARGGISDCHVPFSRILCRGYRLAAAGYMLVHNHPRGDPAPSHDDHRVTNRLAAASKDLEIPLLGHYIIAGDQLTSVGW
jgi:DNA repair protein RadC